MPSLRSNFVKRQNYEKLLEEYMAKLDFFRGYTRSKAEYFQDLWVLKELDFKKGGFFVEFGATNGVDASNTFLLERDFEWQGILAEPNIVYHEALSKNRICNIDNRLVWDISGEKIEFLAMNESYISVAKQDSKLLDFNLSTKSRLELVQSISLTDLLLEYSAPKIIDFVSVDVEGSEYRILKSFLDDGQFKVRLFVIEHNWRDDSHRIRQLLENRGYELAFENISERDFWFRLKR